MTIENHSVEENGPPIETPITGFTVYYSEEAPFAKFSFEYTWNWEVEIHRLTEYPEERMVWFGGPFSQARTQRAGLVLFICPDKSKQGKFATLDEYAADSIEQHSIGPTQILFDSKVTLAGLPAREVVLVSQ